MLEEKDEEEEEEAAKDKTVTLTSVPSRAPLVPARGDCEDGPGAAAILDRRGEQEEPRSYFGESRPGNAI